MTGREWSDITPGTVLGGSYRLVRRIAQGGMGEIHLAAHERLPEWFVVKVLNGDFIGDEDALGRFWREAKVMATLRHPNIVRIVDFNRTALGRPYMVLEHLAGADLAELSARRAPLNAGQVSQIVRQVASALDAAHELGIVHRDLKPENIMVVPCFPRDVVKVIDFGISKARRFGQLTSPAVLMGTPEFMSPEQARGDQDDVGPAADQFALAVIAYLLLAGRTPWGTTEAMAVLDRVVHGAPLPLRDDTSPCWASVESVLGRGMAKRSYDRYSSTLTFSRELDRAMRADGLLREAGSAGSGAQVVSDDADDEAAGAIADASDDKVVTLRWRPTRTRALTPRHPEHGSVEPARTPDRRAPGPAESARSRPSAAHRKAR